MNNKRAPVALFVYNRVDHAARTLGLLCQNVLANETDLIIYSDAPKNPEAAVGVAAVRDLMARVEGFASVRTVLRPVNYGLARSITEGVAEICELYDRVIVLEDDLETSPYFLQFMNDALDRYADVPEVAAVSGFHLPSDVALPETFFQCDAECWGWATWKRAWSVYNPNGAALLAEICHRKMERFFDQEYSYPYVKMLEDSIAGKINSWAVRWRASVMLNDMVSLYPARSLTRNVGFDGSGTHCEVSAVWHTELSATPVSVAAVPVVHDEAAYQAFARFNRAQIPTLKQRLTHKLKRLFKAR